MTKTTLALSSVLSQKQWLLIHFWKLTVTSTSMGTPEGSILMSRIFVLRKEQSLWCCVSLLSSGTPSGESSSRDVSWSTCLDTFVSKNHPSPSSIVGILRFAPPARNLPGIGQNSPEKNNKSLFCLCCSFSLSALFSAHVWWSICSQLTLPLRKI